MVAIVSGNNLGLTNTSAGLLGQNGLIGQAANGATNEEAVVNVSNGNLVLQSNDDFLASQGLDIESVRTYNSQGSLNEGNGAAWSMSMIKLVGSLTGTANTSGSTITRTDGDGGQVVYTYNAAGNNYVAKDGAGADDTLSYNATTSNWTWTDGSTGNTETYGQNGYIVSAADTGGNTLTYSYTNGLLTQITDASGESTNYTYTNGNLTQITDVLANGLTSSRVSYSYDSQNRLSAVTTNLGPSTGDTYSTNYAYVGNSNLISSVTQTDGVQLNFTYEQVGSEERVQTVTDALGNKTTFDYISATQTSVTDPAGNVSVYTYDSQGRLTNIAAPAVNGIVSNTSYAYDSNGDLIGTTDANGDTTTMQYDAIGNRTSTQDTAGDTVTRTYNAFNQLTSETTYQIPADGTGQPGEPETTYYYYSASAMSGEPGFLSYVIGAQGQITEYQYNALNQLATTLVYAGQTLDASQLTGTETVAAIAALVQQATPAADDGAAFRTDVQRTDTTYDARGQVSQVITYTAVSNNAALTGIATDSATTKYAYDQAGNLLSKTSSSGQQTSYTYDGLGRVLSVVDSINGMTTTQYDDADNTITVAQANGNTVTSVYDRDDRLLSRSNSIVSAQNTSTVYDADGRAIMTTDASGNNTWMFYDADGNKVGSVTSGGILTQYVYNADRELAQTITYATLVDTSLLVGANGQPTGVALEQILPAASAGDQKTWQVYDNAGRVEYTIAANGAVTQTAYDGASNAVETIAYARPIDVSNLGSVLTPNNIPVVSNHGQDQVTRNFYDGSNNLVGTLSPTGKLTQYIYNGANELTETRAYAETPNASLWATGTLTELTTGLQSIDDSRTLYTYDGTGTQVGSQVVQGYPDDTMPGVTDIKGTLLQPGEQDVYQFSVTDPSLLFFDGIAGNQIQWKLTDGTQTFYSQDLTANGNTFENLAAGTYQLTVSSNNGTTGNYDFRIMGAAAAASLTTNAATTSELAPGTQAALYSFSANAGDQLSLQGLPVDPPWTWSLFGPNAQLLASGESSNSSEAFSAPTSGIYYLSIQSTSEAATPVPYSLTMFQSTPTTAPLTLGQSCQATFIPGSISNYAINVATAGWLKFDQLSSTISGANWTLLNSAGEQVAYGSGYTGDDPVYAQPLAVAPGTYTLQIENNTANSGSIDFQMLNTSAASVATVQCGQSLSLDSSSGSNETVYQLDVAAATNLGFSANISGADRATWQVTNANGGVVGSGFLGNGSFGNLALSQGGEYFLWIGGAINNSAPLQGSILVTTATNQVVDAGALSGNSSTDLQGTVTGVGQTVTTDFNVAQSGTWMFEAPTALAGAQWSLVGPLGTVVASTSLSSTQESGGIAAYLTAGNYQLVVSSGASIGAFDIRAVPFATATALADDTPTVLASGGAGAATLYSVNATPGDNFSGTLADADGAPNGEEFSVQAFDAYGHQLYSGYASTIQFAQLQASGPVYLLVTQTVAQSAGTTLTLARTPAAPVAPVSGTPIAIGQDVSAPGSGSPLYSLDLSQDDLVIVQSSSAIGNTVTLTGPLTKLSGSLPAYSSQGMQAPAVLGWAPAGDYQLQFSDVGNNFPFTVYTGSSGIAIASGQNVDSTLAAGQSVGIFKIDAQAGQSYQLNGLLDASGGFAYGIYDAYGNLLDSGDPSIGSGQSWSVAQNETCYVVVYRDPNQASQAATINFDVAPPSTVSDLGALSTAQSTLIGISTNTGSTQSASFEVTQAGWWTVQTPSPSGYIENAYWTLSNANGQDSVTGNVYNSPNQTVFLQAGTYSFSVANNWSGNSSSSAPFFKVSPVSVVQAQPNQSTDLGQIVSGQSVAVTLDSNPFSQFSLDVGPQNGPGDFTVQALDRNGNNLNPVWQTDPSTGDHVLTFAQDSVSGPVTVVFTAQSDAADLSMIATRTDVTLVQVATGTPTDLGQLAAGQSMIMQLDSYPLSQFSLDFGSDGGASKYSVQAYDQYGNNLGTTWQTSATTGDSVVTFAQGFNAGQVSVVLTANAGVNTQDISVNATRTDIPTQNGGTIAFGQWSSQTGDAIYSYDLNVTQASTFFVDSDAPNGLNNVWVSDANGNVISSSSELALSPGDYVLHVQANQAQQVSSNIRVTNSADLTPLATNTDQSVQLDPNWIGTYASIALAAGESLNWIPGANGTTDSSAGYSIYDANGNDVYDGNINQGGSFTAQQGGTYTVQMYDDVAATADFSVTITPAAPVIPAPPASLDLGTISATQTTSFSAPANSGETQFTVTQAGWWTVQTNLADLSQFTEGTAWTINTNPNFSWIGDVASGAYPGGGVLSGTQAVYLLAGTYYFSVSGWNASTNPVIDLIPTQPIPVANGVPTDLGQLAAYQTKVLSFAANPLSQFSLDIARGNNQQTYSVQAFDPNGAQLNVAVETDTVTGDNIVTFAQNYLAGPVTVVLSATYGAAATDFTVTATKKDVAPQAAQNGTITTGQWIDQPDSSYSYNLDITQPTTLFLDTIPPGGANVQVAENYNDWQNINGNSSGVWTLQPGDYIVSNGYSSLQAFSFMLTSSTDITPLATNTNQSVAVAANGVATYYSVTLAAGDELAWVPGTASTTGSYSFYDSNGNDVYDGDINQPGVFTAQQAGTYILAIRNDAVTGATVNFSLAQVPVAAPLTFNAGALSAAASSSIETAFSSGNQSATQTFDVTQSGLWSLQSLSSDAGIGGTLTGPLGNIVASWSDLSQVIGQNAVYFLPYGQYTLTLHNQGIASASAMLGLTPLATAVPLDSAATADLSAMTVGQQSWYSIDSQDGDSVTAAIQAQANSDFDISVYDSAGQLQVPSSLNGGSFTTSYDGPVYVLVQRVADTGNGGGTTLSLTANAGASTVALPPVQVGSQVTWTTQPLNFNFNVATDGLVAIQWEAGNYQDYTLVGPSGTVGGQINGAAVQWLVAGNYRLTLSNGSGAAQFLVSDAGDATPITVGTPVSATLSAGQSQAAFDVTLDPSMNTWFDGLQNATPGLSYQLYDSSGKLVASGSTSQGGLARLSNISLNGQYLLLLSRSASASASSAVLNFNILQVPVAPVPLQIGAPTQLQFVSYNQTYSYTFTSAAAAEFALSNISNSDNVNVSYRLVSTSGGTVTNLSPRNSALCDYAISAGSYTLQVTVYDPSLYYSGAQPVPFSFTANLQPLSTLQVDNITQGQFVAYGQTKAYTLSLTAAAELALPVSSGNIDYSVIASNGSVLSPLNQYNYWNTEPSVYSLCAGTYTVEVTNYNSASAAQPLPFSFTANLVQAGTDLAAGTSATVNWSDGLPDQQLVVSAQAGQSYWLAPTTAPAYSDAYFYSVLNAQGSQVAQGVVSGGYFSNTQGIAFTAASSGNYTVNLYGVSGYSNGRTDSTSFSLTQGQLDTAAYAVGGTVTGSLNVPADQSTQQFTLTQPTDLWLSISGGAYTATLTRTDQPATIFSSNGGNAISVNGVYQLAAGTYSLTLTPNQPSPGAYSISSSPVADLPSLTLGTTTQVTSQGNQATAYQLSGTAGQQLLIDPRWVSGNSENEFWALIGPNGQQAASGYEYYGTRVQIRSATL